MKEDEFVSRHAIIHGYGNDWPEWAYNLVLFLLVVADISCLALAFFFFSLALR